MIASFLHHWRFKTEQNIRKNKQLDVVMLDLYIFSSIRILFVDVFNNR